MKPYLILLRGINVGGKNIIAMSALKSCLEELGFANVSTYIASGNVILESDKDAAAIKAIIEPALLSSFKLDSERIKVLVLNKGKLQVIVESKPKGFGDQPEKYHSDVLFLLGIDAPQVMPMFSPGEGVDEIWPGPNVIYSQRLSSMRTKSRLNKIMSSPLYKSMTIRTWGTTIKLLDMMSNMESRK